MNDALMQKTRAVIFSCKTPAQLRVAAKFAYRALGTLRGTEFDKTHFLIQKLLTLKAQTMRSRAAKWKF